MSSLYIICNYQFQALIKGVEVQTLRLVLLILA